MIGVFFFQAEDGIRDADVTGVQTCALPIFDKHMTDLRDEASLQRGAKTYMNYCMGCHSLEYARYNRVAKDLNIPEDLMRENLVFADKKFGDLMTSAMRK